MKNIVALALVAVFMVPNMSLAATNTTNSQNATVLQLIASLLEQIKTLQAQLLAIKSGGATVNVTSTSQSEYQKKVKPLLISLDKKKKEGIKLDEAIKIAECARPQWFQSGDKRTFHCGTAGSAVVDNSKKLKELRDKKIALEKEESEIRENVQALKDEYGIGS